MRPLRRDSCPTRFSLVIYTCAWHTYYQLKYQLKHFHLSPVDEPCTTTGADLLTIHSSLQGLSSAAASTREPRHTVRHHDGLRFIYLQ